MNMYILIALLILVESGGDPNAIGDHGLAVGVLQIHPCVVADVNRVCKTNYMLNDRLNPILSRKMGSAYLWYWTNRYEKETGLPPTPKIMAAIWHLGPRGWKDPRADAYWQKIKSKMT